MGREIYNLNVQSDSIRDKVFNFFFDRFLVTLLTAFGYTSYMCVFTGCIIQ